MFSPPLSRWTLSDRLYIVRLDFTAYHTDRLHLNHRSVLTIQNGELSANIIQCHKALYNSRPNARAATTFRHDPITDIGDTPIDLFCRSISDYKAHLTFTNRPVFHSVN